MRTEPLAAILMLVLVPILAGCGDAPAPAPPPSADAPAPADSVVEGPRATIAADEAREAREAREDSLRSALRSLLAGPSAEERAAGDFSWFSDTTANALRDVDFDGGHVVVDLDADLDRLIPNASTSAGSEILLGDLDSVVFRFPWVETVEYRMGGSCDAFWEWLQRGCDVVTR